MSFNKRFFTTGGIVASSGTAACTTDTADVFGDGYGIALYTLDYDASDASDSYDGSPTNVEFGVDGQINYGARFNGTSSEITVNSFASLSQLGLSMWVNIADITSNYALAARYGTNREFAIYNYQASNGFIASIYYNGSNGNAITITAGDYLTNNTWHHIAFTSDGSTAPKLYIDGVERGTAQFSDAARCAYYTSSEPLEIGKGVSRFLNGKIDQVRIFNRALSSSEVSTLYAETACVYTCTTDTVDYPITNVAYYKLDNSAEDETGTYDGTATNVNYTFGRFGQAAVFNGSSSAITSTNQVIPNGASSVSFWYNPNGSTGTEYILGQGAATASKGVTVYYSSSTFGALVAKGTSSLAGSATTTTTYSNTDWHHVVATWDGTINTNSLKVYVNGSLEAQGTSDTSSASIGAYTYFAMGGLQGGTYAGGKIDQVRFFSSALTSTQVTELYEEYECEDTSTFKPVLYTGNGSTQYISNVGFEPDLVWIKARSVNYDHQLHDIVRGAGNGILSNNSSVEFPYNTVTSFDANGFTVDASTYIGSNANNQTFVAWVFKSGGIAVSNTDGTITSQVSANQDAGFSIVKWTGNDLASQTIGHGLSSTPEITIIKKLTGTVLDWQVNLNSSITGTEGYLNLNLAIALYTTFPNYYTSANSTVLSTNGTTSGERQYNNQSSNYIAYCFHSVAGVSDIGSYTGNTTLGVTVTTGFEPSFIMIRRTDVGNSWVMLDNQRDPINPNDKILWADLDDIEANGGTNTQVNFTSTGFSIPNTAIGGSINANGGTYIYMAFK
jgi:hypothetical protein